jgi:hypothetical protein
MYPLSTGKHRTDITIPKGRNENAKKGQQVIYPDH